MESRHAREHAETVSFGVFGGPWSQRVGRQPGSDAGAAGPILSPREFRMADDVKM